MMPLGGHVLVPAYVPVMVDPDRVPVPETVDEHGEFTPSNPPGGTVIVN
jgi:hypothetical protein